MSESGPRRSGFFRTTLIGGALFLVPVVAIIAIVGKALSLLAKVTVPLARFLRVDDVAGIPAPRLVAIVILVLICFLAGLVARTKLARSGVSWLETNLLSNIPGYTFLKNMSESFAGVEDQSGFQVVLVSIEEDAWQIAFLMEHLEDGRVWSSCPAFGRRPARPHDSRTGFALSTRR
jgi:uncharacterized membrane protein